MPKKIKIKLPKGKGPILVSLKGNRRLELTRGKTVSLPPKALKGGQPKPFKLFRPFIELFRRAQDHFSDAAGIRSSLSQEDEAYLKALELRIQGQEQLSKSFLEKHLPKLEKLQKKYGF
jgi:hypothetical protein